MTITREAALEAALKRLATAVCFGDGGALGIDMSKSPLGREILARMKFAETALSTPATEPQPEIAALITDMEEILRISDRNHPTWNRAWAVVRELKPFLALETP